ncbi:hypothetical protein [Fischerella sp. PCC 9605]|uniref:hypothetical protein n=1 Tax=Fischerella sp. PCC 9605 TaxID=1173024 RepID=UPI00047CD8D5|nr:hypothetical protein [Fischerella sp. PCC 9605]
MCPSTKMFSSDEPPKVKVEMTSTRFDLPDYLHSAIVNSVEKSEAWSNYKIQKMRRDDFSETDFMRASSTALRKQQLIGEQLTKILQELVDDVSSLNPAKPGERLHRNEWYSYHENHHYNVIINGFDADGNVQSKQPSIRVTRTFLRKYIDFPDNLTSQTPIKPGGLNSIHQNRTHVLLDIPMELCSQINAIANDFQLTPSDVCSQAVERHFKKQELTKEPVQVENPNTSRLMSAFDRYERNIEELKWRKTK